MKIVTHSNGAIIAVHDDSQAVDISMYAEAGASSVVVAPAQAVRFDDDAGPVWADGWSVGDSRVVADRRKVEKLTVIDRLEAAGKFADAMTLLGGPGDLAYECWSAAQYIFADDADVVALLTAVGADPAVILA